MCPVNSAAYHLMCQVNNVHYYMHVDLSSEQRASLHVWIVWRVNRATCQYMKWTELMHLVDRMHIITWLWASTTMYYSTSPQWGAADAEIKIPSGEKTELKRSPFKAWSRSVYSHTCYAYCQGFLPYFYTFGPFTCIFSLQNLSRFFLCWLWLIHGSCVGPQNKIGHLPDTDSHLSTRGT